MSNVRTQHPNEPLAPEGLRRMAACAFEQHWAIEATDGRFQVDPKTVRKWSDRFLAEGVTGLDDRSSRPHRSPGRTEARPGRQVRRLRRRHRWGADHLAHETGAMVKKTHPRCPQTNGSIGRCHQALREEWAGIRPCISDRQRTFAYDGFIHFYNHHCAHGALGWSTPAATLNAVWDNLPGEHT